MGTDNTTTATQDETPNAAAPNEVETTSTTVETGETPGTTTAKGTESPSVKEAQAAIEASQREIDRLKASLSRANKEAKDHRLEADQLKEFKAQIEAEKLSEKEKLEKKVVDLQKAHEEALKQAQELKVEHAVLLHAQGLNFNDAADAKRFLDLSAIDFDAKGTPTNVQELLAEVAKSKPYLIKAPASTTRTAPTNGGATNPSRSSTGNDARPLSWELIAELQKDKAQFAARRSEIAQWMSKPENQKRR